MNRLVTGTAIMAAILLLVCNRPAGAIIKVELPVAKMVQQSRAVVVGRVVGTDPQRRAVEIDATEVTKGNLIAAGSRLRVLFPEADARIGKAADALVVDAPIVLFVSDGHRGAGGGIVHIADGWFRAERIEVENGRTPLWRVTQPYDGSRSFPGRTAALAEVVRQIKAGSTGLQDWVSHEVCLGGVLKRADTGLTDATFVVSHDLNDDGFPDVMVGSPKQTRALVAEGKNFVDQTARWGLAAARGVKAAAADFSGDGKADLVIGSQIWIREGDQFIAGPKLELGDSTQWVAMGAGDATGDGKADVAVLMRDGRLLVAQNPSDAGQLWKAVSAALWRDGAEALAGAFANDFGDDKRLHAIVVRPDAIVRYPAGAALAPDSAAATAADFARLTGVPLSAYPSLGAMPIHPLLVAAYDYDGLGRTDFILVTQGGGIALANRGHGAFLINRFAHEQFRPGGRDIKMPKLPFEPSLSGALTAPGRQVPMSPKRKRGNLLVLDGKGQLWEMDNERRK